MIGRARIARLVSSRSIKRNRPESSNYTLFNIIYLDIQHSTQISRVTKALVIIVDLDCPNAMASGRKKVELGR